MCNPDKPLSHITKKREQAGTFTRIRADLADPASVKDAIDQSGSKAAFLYCTLTPNGMNGAIQAMKEGGIEHVVFLSTSIIQVISVKFHSRHSFLTCMLGWRLH